MIPRLYAATNTKTNKLAGALAHSFREGNSLVEISAIGPAAVAVGVKATFVASGFLEQQLEFRTTLFDTRSGSQELTATILEVRVQTAQPTTREAQVIPVKSADKEGQVAAKICAYARVDGATTFELRGVGPQPTYNGVKDIHFIQSKLYRNQRFWSTAKMVDGKIGTREVTVTVVTTRLR